MSELLISLVPLKGDKKILRISLNARERINALSLEMVKALGLAVNEGNRNPDVVLIWIEGEGERGFCAGGDVRSVSLDYLAGKKEKALSFFISEYKTDYSIHMSRTPILVFAHGVVMGGGIGILAGCRHRLLTESSLLAMPELSIGFFPDVGASWFLNRMHPGLGLFLALSGYRMDASDAFFAGLGDYIVREKDREAIFNALFELDWTGKPERDSLLLDLLLADFAFKPPASCLAENLSYMERFRKLSDFSDFLPVMEDLAGQDKIFIQALNTFKAGSPFSIGLSFLLMQRGSYLSLKQAFCLELILAANVLEYGDFHEGVRALLIDRDNKPGWADKDIKSLDLEKLRACFKSPWSLHPLHDLAEPYFTEDFH